MTHRYAEMLGWLQAGQQILGKWNGGAEGNFPESFNTRQIAFAVDGSPGWEFRLKPHTVKIGNREIEAPVLEFSHDQLLWTYNADGTPKNLLPYVESYVRAAVKGGRAFGSAGAAIAAYEATATLLRGEA